MPHPSLGHWSLLPKCCLHLLKAIRIEDVAAVQTLHTAGHSAKQSCPTLTSCCKTRDALLVPREDLSCSHGQALAPTLTGRMKPRLVVTSEPSETEQQVQNVQKVVAPSTAPHLQPLFAALPSRLFPLSWIYARRVQWSLCVVQNLCRAKQGVHHLPPAKWEWEAPPRSSPGFNPAPAIPQDFKGMKGAA